MVYCKIFTLNICKVVHHGKVDVSHVQAKFHSAMAVIAERTEVLSFKLKAKKMDTKQKYINTHICVTRCEWGIGCG